MTATDNEPRLRALIRRIWPDVQRIFITDKYLFAGRDEKKPGRATRMRTLIKLESRHPLAPAAFESALELLADATGDADALLDRSARELATRSRAKRLLRAAELEEAIEKLAEAMECDALLDHNPPLDRWARKLRQLLKGDAT